MRTNFDARLKTLTAAIAAMARAALGASAVRIGSPSPPPALPRAEFALPTRTLPWQPATYARWHPPATAALAAGSTPTSPSFQQSSSSQLRQRIDAIATRTAMRYGVDPALVKAVIAAESNYDPKALSPAGAMGLMQLMPETARDMGVTNPWDIEQNIEGGVKYLAMMLRRYGGDELKALAAYNWGPANLERGGRLPRETREYLRKVMGLRRALARGVDVRV